MLVVTYSMLKPQPTGKMDKMHFAFTVDINLFSYVNLYTVFPVSTVLDGHPPEPVNDTGSSVTN